MSGIEAALIDLGGTLHIEDTAIPGSVEALQRLSLAVLHFNNTIYTV